MTTDVATTQSPNTDLSIAPGQTFFTDKQVAALRQLGVQNASNADLAVFYHQAVRTGLDPFARQIYMIERLGKQTIQTGIDGFRLIARRATDRAHGTLGFESTLWCGEDGAWKDVWLSKDAPAAAKVVVLRDGQPYPAIALWSEYVATKRDGSVTAMWASKPALMLAKCAEALALRRAFPQDLSGIYTSDEMSQANVAPDARPAVAGPGPASRSGVSRLRSAVPPAEVDEVAAAFETPTEDVQDAEVVEEPTAAAPAKPERMTAGQNRQIHALFRDLGIDNEDHQRAGMSKALQRDVSSRGDLTKDEAAFIIESLKARLDQQRAKPVPADDVEWPPVREPGSAA